MITLNLIPDNLLGSEYGKINRHGPLKLKNLWKSRQVSEHIEIEQDAIL